MPSGLFTYSVLLSFRGAVAPWNPPYAVRLPYISYRNFLHGKKYNCAVGRNITCRKSGKYNFRDSENITTLKIPRTQSARRILLTATFCAAKNITAPSGAISLAAKAANKTFAPAKISPRHRRNITCRKSGKYNFRDSENITTLNTSPSTSFTGGMYALNAKLPSISVREPE